ncbi:MAG: acyl-CoA thioesterase, partial [Acidilobaceae archaeon]
SYRIVNPEDSVSHNVLHAGKLMKLLDEIAGIVASKYAGGIAVTGAVDATDFYSPVYVGDVIETHAALTYVGSRSVEVTVKVLARNPLTWEARHTTTSYFTFVHVGKDGRSMPVKEFKPTEEWQKKILAKAQERRERRTTIINKLKSREFLDKIDKIREKITTKI